MKKQLIVPFKVVTWEAEVYDDASQPVTLSKILVRKELEEPMMGTSSGQLLMCAAADGGAGYTIMDRFEVEIEGRKGAFVAIHGGITDVPRAFGRVVPGSGTGELAGITGDIEFKSDADGKRIIFDYSF